MIQSWALPETEDSVPPPILRMVWCEGGGAWHYIWTWTYEPYVYRKSIVYREGV